MAVNGKRESERWNGRVHGGADHAHRESADTGNDLYSGRVTDADLSSSDGKCLGERDEWNLAKVSRRGQWKDPTW